MLAKISQAGESGPTQANNEQTPPTDTNTARKGLTAKNHMLKTDKSGATSKEKQLWKRNETPQKKPPRKSPEDTGKPRAPNLNKMSTIRKETKLSDPNTATTLTGTSLRNPAKPKSSTRSKN